MNRRYYWYKMMDDFFEKDEILMLLDQKDGYRIIVIYLMLIADSLRKNGIICIQIADEIKPIDTTALSKKLGIRESYISKAIAELRKVHLIEEKEGLLYIRDFDGLIGSEGSSASRMRKARASQCDREIDIEKKREEGEVWL